LVPKKRGEKRRKRRKIGCGGWIGKKEKRKKLPGFWKKYLGHHLEEEWGEKKGRGGGAWHRDFVEE